MPRVSKYVPDGLTSLQRKTAKNVARGMSKAEAYRKAGGKSKNPSKEASTVLKKPEAIKVYEKEKQRLDKAMETVGIDEEYMALKYKEWLEAQDPSGHSDYAAQLKAADMRHKIKGDYAPEKRIQANLTGDEFLSALAEKAEQDS